MVSTAHEIYATKRSVAEDIYVTNTVWTCDLNGFQLVRTTFTCCFEIPSAYIIAVIGYLRTAFISLSNNGRHKCNFGLKSSGDPFLPSLFPSSLPLLPYPPHFLPFHSFPFPSPFPVPSLAFGVPGLGPLKFFDMLDALRWVLECLDHKIMHQTEPGFLSRFRI